MKSISDYFQKVSDNLRVLSEDVERIIINKETNANKKDDKEKGMNQLSLSSMQSVTRIRKDKKDLEKAHADPDIAFIEDKIKDIFE